MNANTATPMPQKSRLSNFFWGFWVLAISDSPNVLHAQPRCPCDSASRAQRPINGYQVTLVPTSQRGLGERAGTGLDQHEQRNSIARPRQKLARDYRHWPILARTAMPIERHAAPISDAAGPMPPRIALLQLGRPSQQRSRRRPRKAATKRKPRHSVM
jgi:hypothetical protein